jgi:thioredoxin-related protein
MNKIIRTLAAFFVLVNTYAQNDPVLKPKLYKPEADVKADIKSAVEQAAKEGKHVFLMIGGNWCSWCLRFNDKLTTNDTLKNAFEKNYVMYHLNYSKENFNEEALASLGYPQRFGFPVFVILDGKGNRIHTQSSAYLESGKGYNTKTVAEFFDQWSPRALDPKTYERKRN